MICSGSQITNSQYIIYCTYVDDAAKICIHLDLLYLINGTTTVRTTINTYSEVRFCVVKTAEDSTIRFVVPSKGCTYCETARRRRSHMENTINGEHIVQIRGVQAEGKMAAPEKRLNRFVHLVAMTERLGNALGTLVFTWATVVLLCVRLYGLQVSEIKK